MTDIDYDTLKMQGMVIRIVSSESYHDYYMLSCNHEKPDTYVITLLNGSCRTWLDIVYTRPDLIKYLKNGSWEYVGNMVDMMEEVLNE